MADGTKIEWTDATWNPITGCSVTSPGCTNCYAMKLAGTRLRHDPSRAGLTEMTKTGPIWNGQIRFNEKWLTQPLQWKRGRKIFVCAHGDLFHESVPDEWIDRVFAVMALCPQHTFQVLTKRSARMREYMTNPETPFRVAKVIASISGKPSFPEELRQIDGFPGYLVSSHGHIYSDKRGKRRRLRPDAGEQGHLRVPLYREGGPRRGYKMLVHRLVLEAFDSPAPSMDAQGRHLDGTPSNNAISNLTWGGQSANWDDSKRHGTFRRYSKLTPDQVNEIKRREPSESAASLGREFGVSDTQIYNIRSGKQWVISPPIEWPLTNVWKGVSVEDQTRADERIPDLLATPAAVRFLSCEPLLGPVDLRWIAEPNEEKDGVIDALLGCNWVDGSIYERGEEFRPVRPGHQDRLMRRWVCSPESDILENRKIDWVIVGGEAGPSARPMHPDWARSLRDQCAAAGTAFFMKQWGSWWPANPQARCPSASPDDATARNLDGQLMLRIGRRELVGRLLDGVEHNGFPA